ncbi:unnamed protein product [Polarella glacialis]|uniref:Dynein light chain n=1 Tax=Polarella glacialis TaxID=89957 RepID=A0A813LHI8_POLGL|nr:unnamed protein product [Polarella glacialis]CAE8583260.1 unnamed protein product [Polarella glacialis]CAE8690524.1 unnamed protein product [Polarella glacialis]CAE8724149.1 unnamed protein product [Polarella glacialis]
MATERKVQIKNADMDPVLQQEIVEVAKQAMDKHSTEREVANFIKKEMDKRDSPYWHVTVGRNFGCYVTHETKYFLYFNIDQLMVLCFKAG